MKKIIKIPYVSSSARKCKRLLLHFTRSTSLIKIGILLVFLTTIVLTTYNTVYADTNYEIGGFYCISSCKVDDIETGGHDGKFWRQASPEKCENDTNFDPEENKCEHGQCCESITDSRYKGIYGNYDMKDLLTKAIEISNQLLGIVGSIALLFFIIAGIKMIFSGGSEEKISSARTMMVQTIIGLIIFLSAFLIISFVQETLMDSSDDSGRYKLETEDPNF